MPGLIQTVLSNPVAQVGSAVGAIVGIIGSVVGVVRIRAEKKSLAAQTEQALATTEKLRLETKSAAIDIALKNTELINKLQDTVEKTGDRLLVVQEQLEDLAKLKPRVEELEGLLKREKEAREQMRSERDDLAEKLRLCLLQVNVLQDRVEALTDEIKSKDIEIARQTARIIELEDRIRVLTGHANPPPPDSSPPGE